MGPDSNGETSPSSGVAPDDEGGLTARRYTRVAFAATISLAVIIATGAAVRLTQSGLGCEDWPTCTQDSFAPVTAEGDPLESSFHAWVEFGNRLFTGVVALAVVVAVLMAYRVRPVRTDLRGWAWGLVCGVLLQIVVGGITVRTDLNPLSVTTHFLISMVLMWNALVLTHRSGTQNPFPLRHRPLKSWLHLGSAALVLITGTVVTGTGPNSGDARADRLPFALDDVAQIHSATVWAFLAFTVWLAWHNRRRRGTQASHQLLLVLILLQGALGYVQYAVGVPPLLVQLHVIGSILVWSSSVWIFASASPTPDERTTSPELNSSPRRRVTPAMADGAAP